MKLAYGVLSALLLAMSAIECATTQAATATPMTHCDVINEDFCFALPTGSTSVLSMPVDFKLYEVKLANNQKILVYYGSQPNYPPQAAIYSESSGVEKISLYRQEEHGQQHIDAIYEKKREKFTVAVHVQASYDDTNRAFVEEFLASFLKCDSARKGLIECASEPVFAALSGKL